MWNRIKICGVHFDNINFPELETFLREARESDKGQVFIVTPNVDFIVRAAQNSEFKEILNNADLSLCDSSIVLLSSVILRKRLKARVTGFDATNLLLSPLSYDIFVHE